MISKAVIALLNQNSCAELSLIKKESKQNEMYFLVKDNHFKKGVFKTILSEDNEVEIEEILPCENANLEIEQNENGKIYVFVGDESTKQDLDEIEQNFYNEKLESASIQ